MDEQKVFTGIQNMTYSWWLRDDNTDSWGGNEIRTGRIEAPSLEDAIFACEGWELFTGRRMQLMSGTGNGAGWDLSFIPQHSMYKSNVMSGSYNREIPISHERFYQETEKKFK